MNRNQWFVLGGGLFLLSILLLKLAPGCSILFLEDSNALTSCYVQRYALGVPGMILHVLGGLFIILGFLEKKKK